MKALKYLEHIYLKSLNRLLKVCYVLATSAVLIAFFSSFLLQPLTVLMKQTRQLVRAVKQSIYLDVYDLQREGNKRKFLLPDTTFDSSTPSAQKGINGINGSATSGSTVSQIGVAPGLRARHRDPCIHI